MFEIIKLCYAQETESMENFKHQGEESCGILKCTGNVNGIILMVIQILCYMEYKEVQMLSPDAAQIKIGKENIYEFIGKWQVPECFLN